MAPSMKIIRRSNAVAQSRPEGTWQIRVFLRKAVGKRDLRYLVRCGCCEEHFEIYYGDGTLEIAGVVDDAIGHCRELLRLNTNDNPGVRYVLLPALLAARRDGEAGALLEQYADDPSAA